MMMKKKRRKTGIGPKGGDEEEDRGKEAERWQ
jgi:hypothetical protein